MTADLHRDLERQGLDRRSGNDRRIAARRRRRTDRTALIPIDDEDEVRRRMLGRGEESRLRHVVPAAPDAVRFDAVDDRRPPTLLMRGWTLLRALWSWR